TADFAVCVDAASFALTGSSPAGGTYSGPGVSGGNFDAATAGVGAHTITYSYTDGNGCSNSCTFTITVNALPVVTAGSYGPVCVDAADITLVGSPSGGTWSGTGVTGDQFDPSAGTQTVTYIYTDGNGCSNSDVTTITVDDLATVAAAGMDQLQCDNTTFTMAGNTPGVGTGMWTIQSGPGSITNPADPGTTVTGVTSGSTTVLRWTITNGQCSNYDEVSLVSTGVGVACDDGNPNTLNDVYNMSCVCVGTDFVDVALVAMLEGPFVELDDRMNDKLRDGVLPVVYPLIPSAQPYNVAPYNYAGSETVAPAVLAVTDFDDAIVDWVLVEIRSSIIPALVLHTRAALIQRDGDIVDTDGVSPVRFLNVPLDNYYLAVRHRNHLGIMTAAGYPLSGTPSTIDLTLSSTLTYGTDARKAVGGRMVMWQGNTKGLLGTDRLRYTGTNNDRDAILLKIGGMVPTLTWNGYTVEDGTMNGQVKYTGAGNDRDPILVNVNGVPTNQRFEQLP
ncbi:MAG TPA: HYR domain-containing protein, partial [Flavobacteriales bacterium]|nr:HYR domain-containing protein [Flavobacteriales bacterium]